MNPNWEYRVVEVSRFGKSLQAWSNNRGKWFHIRWLKET